MHEALHDGVGKAFVGAVVQGSHGDPQLCGLVVGQKVGCVQRVGGINHDAQDPFDVVSLALGTFLFFLDELGIDDVITRHVCQLPIDAEQLVIGSLMLESFVVVLV